MQPESDPLIQINIACQIAGCSLEEKQVSNMPVFDIYLQASDPIYIGWLALNGGTWIANTTPNNTTIEGISFNSPFAALLLLTGAKLKQLSAKSKVIKNNDHSRF